MLRAYTKSQISSPAVKTATKVSVYYSLSDHNEAVTSKALPLLLCLVKGPQQLLRNRALTLPHQISFQTIERQITLSLQSHIKIGPISKPCHRPLLCNYTDGHR